MIWWAWLVVGAASLLLVAFAFRRQLRWILEVTKALCSDERLPRPLRWGLKAALAIKLVPFPDFGLDEVILIVIGVLLVTIYRPTLRAILDDSRVVLPRPEGGAGVTQDGGGTASREAFDVVVEAGHSLFGQSVCSRL